jgi:hypothetical protein
MAALTGARAAEAIVTAIDPDDRYPRRRPSRGSRRRGIEMSPLQKPIDAALLTNALVRAGAD